MEIAIQYVAIALIFIAALFFLVKKFLPSKRAEGGCNKGCGCSMTAEKPKTKTTS